MSGAGQMVVGNEVIDVEPGVSIHIPVATRFQFRCSSDDPLEAVAVTMPPWPDDDEAVKAPTYWP